MSDSPHTPGELLDFPPHLVPRALIGEGAFARVTAALDATGQEVAVKILSPNWAQDTEACWRFAAEFRRLQRLNGLGFPRALEQGLTPAGRPYYVMSRVFGEPLVPTRPLSATDVRARLSGVAAVLSAVHDLGWVHGDVKSQNLILTPQGELVMLDVGLMASVGQRPEVIAGTLEYLAPEAWRRAPLQPSRDVYALGVLGYRLWTGQLPFAGGPAALAKGHLQAMPVPAQELARDSDAGLARILACLLDKDPTARPADARGVAALLAGDEGKQPRALRLASGGFVGRREVLERWQGALLASGSTWLGLWGHTGVGKSYALDALIPLTRVAGWTWMGVACLAGGAAAALARAVVTKALALAGTPPVGPLAAWLVGEIAPEWWALEPVSRKVVIFSVAASALATAANVLGGLAIALDDAQLADSASQDFLAFMQRVEQLAPIAWVLTGPARLASWPADSPEVTLAPFTPGEVAEHLQFRLGSQPPDRLWQELGPLAGGNPLAIDTLLDHLVASGQLRGDGGHWELAGLALPTDLGTVWHARVETLDALTRRVAAALHTSHGEIPAAWLATSLQVSEASVADALDGLLACGMAVQGAQGPRLASDLFGELFSPAATPSERAHWATEWARRLLGMANPAAKPSGRSPLSAPGSETTDFDALMHAASLAIDGDDPAFALRLAGEAAARAFGMGAPFEAHGLAGRALALRDAQTARELLLPLFLARAEAGRFLDRLQEATTDYEAALACSPAPQARLTALVGLAKCVQMKGDYANATELLRQAEGLAITLEDPAQCARVVSTLARLEVFGGNLEQAERHGERSVSLARQAGVPSILAQVLTLQGNVCFQRDLGRAPEARAILAEALALSESLGDRVGEGMANDALGNLYMALGELSAAASAFERFASVCALAGLATEGLMADLNAGIAAGDAADWRRSLAHGESVAARARAAGRRFVLGAALAVVGQGRWLCGDVAGCEKPLDEALELALTLGNAVLETLVRLVRLEVALGLGDVAMATSEAECLGVLTARTAQVEASGRLAARKAQLALLRGDRPLALALATELATTNDQVAAHIAQRVVAAAARDMPTAEAAVGRALAIAEAWQSAWHQASDRLLLARILASAGQTELALGSLSPWLADSEAWGEDPAHPATSFNIYALAGGAKLAAELNSAPFAGPALAATKTWWAGFAGVWPAERRAALAAAQDFAGWIDTLPMREVAAIDMGRLASWFEELAAERDEPRLREVALQAVMALMGATRGYVLAFEGGRLTEALTVGIDYDNEVAAGFSQSIAERALFGATPLYVVDAANDGNWKAHESVQALGLRTVVALPLAAGDRLIGVIYADRPDIEPLLQPSDVALLGALAATATAGILSAREARNMIAQRDAAVRTAALAAEIARDPAHVRLALLHACKEAAEADRALWLGRDDAKGPFTARLDVGGTPQAPLPISQRIADWVASEARACSLLDASEHEVWGAEMSVQALGLRTVWAVPVDADLIYLVADAAPQDEGGRVVATLEALVAFAAPWLAKPGPH